MKIKLLLLLLFFGINVNAQIVDSLPHHQIHQSGRYYGDNILCPSADGYLLSQSRLLDVEGQFGTLINFIGNVFYKIDYRNGMIVDSVLFPSEDPGWCWMYRKAENDNIWCNIVRDLDSCKSEIQISHFNDNLSFSKQVAVPLDDTLVYPIWRGFLVESPDTFVFCYRYEFRNEVHIVRMNINGAILQERTLRYPEELKITSMIGDSYIQVFNSNPLEYVFTGHYQNSCSLTILDSLFQVVDYHIIDNNYVSNNFLLDLISKTQTIEMDDGSFVLATSFQIQHPESQGTCLIQIDKDSFEQEMIIRFPSYPLGQFTWEHVASPPIDILRSHDGGLYFIYATRGPLGYCGNISIAKLDRDLNIEWRRYCLETYGYNHLGMSAVLLEYGLAVGGLNIPDYSGVGQDLFFIVLNDEGVGTTEMEAFIRPYLFWPNPVQDQLSLNYSPDVQPQAIELYDLQGRLVRSQTTGFESLSMEGLAAGQYVMKVTMEDGKVFTDKVIKTEK